MSVSGWTPKAPAALQPSRTRLPAAEVRRRMLQQGHHVIRQRGLTVGLEDIRMEDLIAAAEVPRSSVWRIWASKSEYTAELVRTAVDPEVADLRRVAFDPGSRDVAAEMVRGFEGRLGTPEERRLAFLEMNRVLTRRHLERLVASPAWRTYTALLASVPAITPVEARQRLARGLEDAERQYHDAMAGSYEAVFPRLGLRLRSPGYTYRHLAVATAAVVEGLALRGVLASLTGPATPGAPGAEDHAATPHPDDAPPSEPAAPADPADPADTSDAWTLAETLAETLPGPGPGDWSVVALAVVGIVDAFVEVDPGPGRAVGPTG